MPNEFADPFNPNMFTTPHHIGGPSQTSEGFITAKPNHPLVARYDPTTWDDSDRQELKSYIEKHFNCTARKDGTDSDKAGNAYVLNPQEKKAGFLAFDFKNRGDAKRCETELNGKKVLGKSTLRVCSLTNQGWQYFDGCSIDPKIKNEDVWSVEGRMDGKKVAFRFDHA